MSKPQAEPQMLDDIEVPDIEIEYGWPVSDVVTAGDCDDAFAYLMAAVAEIEHQLEMKGMGVVISADPMWPARARRALKYKRAALQLVGYKRGRIAEERKRKAQGDRDRLLLEHIKSLVSPQQFYAWVVSSGVATLPTESEAA